MLDQVKLTPAQKAAATRQAKKNSRRPSIAHHTTCLNTFSGNKYDGTFSAVIEDLNLEFVCPNLKFFNSVVEKLGYKPVRITYNMLNKEAGPIIIDRDTPSYCDVGSEAYHSM
jgi:hypothetical protein